LGESDLIIIFARAPEDERWEKVLRPQARACAVEALHRALLDRTLAAAAAVPGTRVRLVTTGDLERAHALAARRIQPERLEVAPQIDGPIGLRLVDAVEGAFADGYARVVLVGGDTPELQGSHIIRALAALAGEAPAAALGPAPDGGYYLLGLNHPLRSAFVGIPFGTDEAGAATAHALARAGFAVESLPPLADVDDLPDLVALSRRLRGARSDGDLRLRRALLDVLADDVLLFLVEKLLYPRSPTDPFGKTGPPSA
jgi:rSAM/selenodomain-associated transferase 1